jgi:hypothetical protein
MLPRGLAPDCQISLIKSQCTNTYRELIHEYLLATHVVAGNVMSRTLAEQGAEVLHLVDPQSFEHESLYIDACVGFQSSWLDLKQPEGRQRASRCADHASRNGSGDAGF